jgi:hypothetical protein
MLAAYSLREARAVRLSKADVDQVKIKSTQENFSESLGNIL